MDNERDNDLFEETLKNALRAAYQPVMPPDSKKSFYKIKMVLNKETKRILWKRRIQLIAVSVALMFFGTVAFGSIQEARGFSPVYRMIQKVKDGFVMFTFGTEADDSNAKTLPLPDMDNDTGGSSDPDKNIEDGVSIRKEVTLEEAKSEVIFNFYIPDDIPLEFELKKIEIFYRVNRDKAHMVFLWYENLEERSFGISQNLLGNDVMLTSGLNQSSGTSKEIQIQGYTAILVNFTDGRTNLKSFFNDVFIDISGDLDEEQIISMANSMK